MSIVEAVRVKARSVSANLRKLLGSDSEPKSITARTSRSKYAMTWRRSQYLILPLLSAAAFHCLWILSFNNGFLKQLGALRLQPDSKYPGTDEPMLLKYTGIGAVDRQLTVMVGFFSAAADHASVEVTLFSLFGLGQFAAAWTLFMLESFRKGNAGRLVSYVGVYGFLVQNFGLAVVTPLYLLLHLITSPVATAFPAAHASSVLLVSSYDMAILPFSVILGYIVPTVLMILPVHTMVSVSLHQKLIAFWQPFPIWSVLIHYLLKHLYIQAVGKDKEKATSVSKPIQSPSSTYLKSAGTIYRMTLFLCMFTHIPVLCLTLIPGGFIPEAYQTLIDLTAASFSAVYIPSSPLPPSVVDLSAYSVSLANGVHQFLQWDVYIASLAALVWAILLNHNASEEKQAGDPQTSLPIYKGLLNGERGSAYEPGRNVLVKLFVWTVLAGPFGAVTMLLWDRDMIVRQKVKQGI